MFGIEIRLDRSWLLIAFLVTFSLGTQLSAVHAESAPYWSWVGAVLGAGLFFGSLLAHELSHSMVARARGAEVFGITLFVFGGISQLKGEPRRPKDEFLIAVVGPLMSAALGGLFLLVASFLPPRTVPFYVASWLGTVNFVLAVFNLLPGYPLDGGRIFRAGAWAATRDLKRATRMAARVGMAIGVGLMVWGGFQFFVWARFFSGVWIAFIGWFLMSAAQRSMSALELRDLLGGYRVAGAMRPSCPRADPDETVEHLVEERILGTGTRCFLVSGAESVLGLITLHEIKGIPREAWPSTPLKEAMVPLDQVAMVAPDDSLLKALEVMSNRGVNQLPVMDGPDLVGMVTREDVLRILGTNLELGSGDAVGSGARYPRGVPLQKH